MSVIVESIPQPANKVKEYWKDRPMGEVRVDVELINAVDGALCVEGKLPEEKVRTYRANAMVDTGAICTVIPEFVAAQLGLVTMGEREVSFADGRKEVVPVVAPMQIEILGRDTFEEALVLGDEVLIGQTVLEKTDLLVDCAHACVVPNPAHPDQPIVKVKGFHSRKG
jgi:clan AA aspartic protease